MRPALLLAWYFYAMLAGSPGVQARTELVGPFDTYELCDRTRALMQDLHTPRVRTTPCVAR